MLTAHSQPIPPVDLLETEASDTQPARMVQSLRRSPMRALGVAACAMVAVWAIVIEHLTDPGLLPLFLFFTGLSLIAILCPATGPRGQRVGLIPAVGLAALLLLPPASALLPVLLANTAYAFSRELPLSRHSAYDRGFWLLLAIGLGGLLHLFLHVHSGWPEPGSPLTLLLVSLLYSLIYGGGRLFGLLRHFRAQRTVRRHAWRNWKLEVATLAATVPIALLMALAYPLFGLPGVAAAAVLLSLMLLAAHFGFEVALLGEQVRAMEKLSAVTVSQATAPQVIDRFLQLSGSLISCDRAALWLTDDSHTRLDRVTSSRPPTSPTEAASVRFGEGLVGRIAERKQPLLVHDGTRDPRLSADEQRGGSTPFSLLLLPLVAGNETMGVVQFERDAPGILSKRDRDRVRALASQAAATLANVHSHQYVHNQAITDGLTGLFNRRHMQAVLVDERRRAQRYGHTLSVIMLDVDGFKTYNDTYGHVQGDVLLQKLACILRESVRDVDTVGRYGGEEFIVILPETTAAQSFQAAERLRLAVARTVFPGFADDPGLVVFKTISLGAATFPDNTEDTQALVSLADGALYQAKHGGRNQTVLAG